MSNLIHFETPNGRWTCFDSTLAELILPTTPSHPQVVYRLPTSDPAIRWVIGSETTAGRLEYAPISERMVARVFVERGMDPPEDLAYQLVLDEVPRPWKRPGAKNWVGVEEACIDETLYQTTDSRFVIERRDRSYDQNRFEAVTPSIAANWLATNGFDGEADMIAAVVKAEEAEASSVTPEQRGSLAGAGDAATPRVKPVQSLAEARAEMTIATAPSQQDWIRPPVINEAQSTRNPSPSHLKAYYSFQWAEQDLGEIGVTDKEAYRHIKNNGCDYYDSGDLPIPKTWTRYVRKARKYFKKQKYNRHFRGALDESIKSITRAG